MKDFDFLRGVLLCLQHVYGHDMETMYHEIVRDVGARDLVQAARKEDAVGWSGLHRYGYCDSIGRIRTTPKDTA
jgi:hypothetical protein